MMSRIKVVKGSQEDADEQRRIFDEWCTKRGIERTSGGSWIVYKGCGVLGRSPCRHGFSNQVDYAVAAGKQATVRGEGYAGGHNLGTTGGGRCDIDETQPCSVGIHFCFNRTAARYWGRNVFVLHVPPSAVVCLPKVSRSGVPERLSAPYVKARASHVRVMGKAKPTRGPNS